MKIVLVGYMASGKSSVGKVLADNFGYSFIDLDEYIEYKEAASITEIFTQKGEIYFRIKEIEYLKEILSLEKNIILSVGGGAPCYGENMKLINDTATALYLKASIKTLVDRLNKEKKNRPLVANLSLEKMSEFIGKHLFERAYFYEQAKFIVKIDDRTIEEIVEEIKTKLV
jgi:shikimate kinase|tara:strand:+ start:149 stop:661 length:513 start_codon:yes stop_codon:yes gene_type:complete